MTAIPDGYTSASMIVSYIRKHFPDIEVIYIFHEGRQHGLTPAIMEQLEFLKPDLLLLPDSSSSDLEQHSILKSNGVDIIVLDHHDLSEESKDAIIVSNHEIVSLEYSNRELSGAGIVLKFIEALDMEYGIDESKNYYDLAAVGCVADMVTILHPETRYYIYEGLKNVKNSFIRQLIYKNAYHALNEAYPKIVSWHISNFMNATIRMGTQEDKDTMFRALLGEKETLHRISKYRGVEKEVSEELHETAVRLATNARSRQNTLKKKLISNIKEEIELKKIDENSFIIVTLDEFKEGFSGFVAGDLVKVFRKPVLITSWNEEAQSYTGSLRGYDAVMLDTRKYLDGLGLFNFASGHGQAAGVSFTKDNLARINRTINNEIGDTTTPIEVDFEISSKMLNESLVKEFYQYNFLWCKGFDEPIVIVKDVELNCANITFGNTMKATVNGVELMAFQIDERLQDLAKDKKIAVCDVIGSLEINHYLGKETPQMKIESLIIKEVKDDLFNGFLF